MLVICISATFFVSTNRPRLNNTSVIQNIFSGARGEKGLWTEKLPRGEFSLACESSESLEGNIILSGVTAKYVENNVSVESSGRVLIWHITAPTATRNTKEAIDILDGPLTIRLEDTDGIVLGHGKTKQTGPSMLRKNDVWRGLVPLHWTHEDDFGKGDLFLPAGWQKLADDQFVVDNGPVIWNSGGQELINSLTSDKLSARGFADGVLTNVVAVIFDRETRGGGTVKAEVVEIAENNLRFVAPIQFVHNNGWEGSAQEGVVLRSSATSNAGSLELRQFNAWGVWNIQGTKGSNSSVNVRNARANGVRWTVSGIHMEGDVQWNIAVNKKIGTETNYFLRSPRAFYRSALGTDLPKSVGVDSIRAEGNPILTWKDNTLNSSVMTYFLTNRTWFLDGPVYCNIPRGSISSGAASGTDSQWKFDGPVRANYAIWGTLQGDNLVWSLEDKTEESIYTFTGKPATLTTPDRRLSGKTIIAKVNNRSENKLSFPNGIEGSFNSRGETVSLRSNLAEVTGHSASDGNSQTLSIREIKLMNKVECSSQNYRFLCDRAIILYTNSQPNKIIAEGNVSLYGNIGTGTGDKLEITFENGLTQPVVKWFGKVEGILEVSFE